MGGDKQLMRLTRCPARRADVGMTTPFMDAYVRLLIQTCHR